MTIDDILNSDLSDTQKISMIEILRKGGKTKNEEQSEEVYYSEPTDAEKDFVILLVYQSPSNFTSRLRDPNRQFIDLGDGIIGTHKMAWASDDDDLPYIIFPVIQEIHGKLLDFSDDIDAALKYAKRNNDYIRVSTPEQADWFTKNYKKYFPGFDESDQNLINHFALFSYKYKEGGSIKTLQPAETIFIGNKEYDVEIADTPEKREDGLSRCKSLKKDEGMLFIHEDVTDGWYTMKDTDIDLDIVFINEEGRVIKVTSVEAHDPDPIECKGYKYVLEVNINSNIEVGDELDLEDDTLTDEEKEQVRHSKMLVLNSDGDVQMKLVGGERIVSMIKTRQLIKAALKAYKSDNDSDYRRVGKLIFKELDALDSREPLYTSK